MSKYNVTEAIKRCKSKPSVVRGIASNGNHIRLASLVKESILWEYEDELELDLTTGMYNASIVDIVRMYPYVMSQGTKYYIEE